MIFKGTPNMSVHITNRTRTMPMNFRFSKDGYYETENPELIERMKRRFKIVDKIEETTEIEKVIKIEKITEIEDYSEMSYKEIRQIAKDRGINTFKKSKEEIEKELISNGNDE